MLLELWNKCNHIRLKIMALLVVIILDAFLAAASVSMILPIVNASINGEEVMQGSRFADYIPDIFKDNVYTLLGALAALLFIKFCIALIKTVFSIRLTEGLQLYWQEKLARLMITWPYSTIASQQQGALANNLVYETGLASNFVYGYLSFLSQLAMGASVIVLLFIVNWLWIGTILLIALIAWFTVGRLYFKKAGELGRKSIKIKQQLNSMVIESLQGIKDIKISNSEDLQVNKISDKATALNRNRIALRIAQSLPLLGKDLIFAALIIFGVLFMPRDTETLKEIVPQLALFLVAFTQLATNLSSISSMRFKAVSKYQSFKLVTGLLTDKDAQEAEDLDKGKKVDLTPQDLSFDKVLFHYDGKNPVVKNLSLRIKKGEIVCISGPSGSGKTTLMDLLARLYQPQEGSIRYGDQDIAENSLSSWRRLVGYVPQEPIVYHGSVRENITLGHDDITDKQIMQAIKDAELQEDMKGFTDGLDTKLYEGGSNLSGGQRKRLALARALAHKSQIIVLDETTNAIQQQAEQNIINNLKKKKITTLIISHRESTQKMADRSFAMQSGKLKEMKI